jgi:hypothetical protein
MSSSAVYTVYGLPTTYHGIGYADTGISKAKQEDLEKKVPSAPMSGTLVVQGLAAPIINQFITLGKKVRGIDFLKFSASAFDEHQYPVADVVVLYNVGVEVSTNFSISGQVFRKILKQYSEHKTLLIIETNLGKTDLLSRYDFRVVNFVKIDKKPEDVWI